MDRILGQPAALETLQKALGSGRFHHAWILSGPRGVGKFTTALEVAKVLLDPAAAPDLTGRLAADPDGETARLVDAGRHPDLHVIRKELALYSDNAQLRSRKLSNIPLDVLREHVIGGRTSDDKYHDGPAYRTSSRGHGKVFVIDEAELIDANGQNALLKTVEEPPPATYLILVTARPQRLLPTIQSRCQHVRFGRLDAAALAAWIDAGGLDGIDRDIADDERAWIERFCDGAPGVARLAAEYGFASWQRRLDPMIAALEAGRFPPGMGALLAELVEEFAQAWVKRNRNASKDAANKDGAGHLLTVLASHARRRLAEACEHAAPPDAAAWLAAIDRIAEAERELAANVNMKHVLENLVVQWAESGSAVTA